MHKNHSFLLRLLVIVNLICWVQCLPSDAASPEKRVALVIGNSAYQNTPALPNPRNDATEIGKVLKRLGFEVDVQVDLTKSTLDKVLRQFGDRLEGAHVAVFYYAGHGIQVAGTNYLIPVDATLRKEKDLYFEVSELNLVLQQMEGAQRVNLVFLDACRDNPLSKKLAEGMGSGRSTLIGRGLAPMKASDGTMISYATKDGEVASDGKGKHSPYSQAILNHIEAPMEISQMLRKVREDVKKITDNRQTPWEYGSLTGDFYFTGPIKVEISQEPAKSDSKSKMEALYWQSIMNDNDPAVFESYLKKYPDGEFSDLAKIKISNLKKGQKNEILPSLEQPVQSDSKKAYGYLKLTSDPPGASVLLDGSPLGNTDMDASNIEPGKRKIEIQKDCFKVKTAEVMIKAGQQVSMNLKLEPSCGGISATSDPSGADILIDNKPVGITPAEVLDISEGKHQITIRKDGFQDWQEGIVVKTGKTVAVKSGKLKSTAVGQQTAADTAGLPAMPQPEYRLTIDSNPADAKTTIPLPQDVQIVAPDPTLSPEIKAFSGIWFGVWGGVLKHILVVEQINPPNATAIYAVGEALSWKVAPGFARVQVQIEPRVLKMSLRRPATVTYRLQSDDTLDATYEWSGGISRAKMKRDDGEVSVRYNGDNIGGW